MTVYLHIGFPKTATTSIQIMFRDNVENLKKASVCYPLIDKDFKQRYLKLFDTKSSNSAEASTGPLDISVRKMIDLAKSSNCKDVVLSCEELTNFMMMQYNPENLKKMREAISEIDTDIKIVVYVRNPSDFYLSILQEKLKRYSGVLDTSAFRTNFAKTIAVYEEVFETTAIVREFSPKKLFEGDIVKDFLHATGLNHVDVSSWKAESTNESVSPEVLVALDLARRQLKDTPGDLNYKFNESEMLWRKLNNISQELGFSRKPILYKSVHDTVCKENAYDAAILRYKYGIDFSKGKFIDSSSDIPKSYHISEIQSLMDVNVEKSMFIWSKFVQQSIREIFRLREKIQNIPAQAKTN